MGTGYTRNDTGNNIADGNVINASDLDGEFDAVVSAFDASTGHTHDGTSAEGAPVTVVGPAQDFVVSATDIKPKTTNTLDIGTSALQFKNLYIDGTGYIDAVDIDGGNIDGTTIGAASAAAITGTTITGTSFVSSGNMTFGDNDKAIFGASSDLQIYHDGSHSYIQDAGTGEFRIKTNGNIIQFLDGSNNYLIRASVAADVGLYYNTAQKLATTSTGISVTGNVVVSGTVDGRDVATDGTKLDGIESNATADQTAGEILTALKTVDGSGSGLDADLLDGISSGSFLRSDAADTKSSGDLTFSDSVKAIFGSGSDLQLYHNGSNSYIIDAGTGNLFIGADTDVKITNAAANENKAVFTSNGAVELYYDNAKKIETASGGVSITGNITVSGTVDGRDVAADGSKLDGIESGATADQSASEILTLIKTVDGAGSGLDADLLDGISSASFLRSDTADTATGVITLNDDLVFGNRTTTDGHIQLYNGTAAGGYAIGVEANTTYYRSATNHRWYIGTLADGGSSDRMELTSSGLSLTGNITVSGTVDGRDIASDGSKLDGIESGATADQSASEILTAIKTVDGAGSGLDADTVDGQHASAFLTGNQTITLSGDVTGSGSTSISTNIAANVVGASELNVSGNGTTSQFLRSDGDGSFSWATPAGGVTSITAGTGLSGGTITSSGTIALSHLGLESLTDPNADKLAFWDDSAGAFKFLGVGQSGLEIIGTELVGSFGNILSTSLNSSDNGNTTGNGSSKITTYGSDAIMVIDNSAFGWHDSGTFDAIWGVYIGSTAKAVNKLTVSVHANSFGNFQLQGSNNANTSGTSIHSTGTWTALTFTSTGSTISSQNGGGTSSGYSDGTELIYKYTNNTAYTHYRIVISDVSQPGSSGATGGWATLWIKMERE